MAVVIWLGRRGCGEVGSTRGNVSSFVGALQEELIGNKWRSGSALDFLHKRTKKSTALLAVHNAF